MSLVDIFKQECSELVDEDAALYVEEALHDANDAREASEMISQLLGRECTSDEFDTIKKLLHLAFQNQSDDLTDQSDGLIDQSDDLISNSNRRDQKVKQMKRSKPAQQKYQTKATADSPAAKWTQEKKSHGQFLTKRFERFHRTWTGNEQWKVQPHRLAEQIEELDDDDYSSAWLECLRLGIPWGGRGAGGRGVTRVTGQVKDVHIDNCTMAKGGKELLSNSLLRLMYGKRYALVGRNGVGKTTLLRRIALGSLAGFPPWLKVQYVEQELKGTDMTPVEFVTLFHHERTRLLAEEDSLLLKMENTNETAVISMQLTQVYEALNQMDAFEFEDKVELRLRAIGFTDDLLKKSTKELSGGWRMRAALCGALIMDPDLIVMDEPTNHLDADGVEWLQNYLADQDNFAGTLLLVSHDQCFLNHVTNETIVFRKKQLTYFAGTYGDYKEMKVQERTMQNRKMQSMEKRKKELESYIKTQQKGATDKKSKGGDPKKQKQIRSRRKKMEKMEEIGFGNAGGNWVETRSSYRGDGVTAELDTEEKPLYLNFLNATILGYGDVTLLENLNVSVTARSRIGILGKNGAGKTSLVKCMMGQLEPQCGRVCRMSSLKVGVFSQDMVPDLPLDKTPVELVMLRSNKCKQEQAFENYANVDTVDKARSILGRFGLHGDLGLQSVNTLSGGQKSRVVFAMESIARPDLYIMDEPTNQLDVESIEVLVTAIKEFNGAVIIISHDKYLLESSVSDIWLIDPKKMKLSVHTRLDTETKEEFFQPAYSKFLNTF